MIALFIIIVIVIIIYVLAKTNSDKEDEKQAESRRREEQAEQARLDNWVNAEYEKIKIQQRTEEEIKKYAQVKYHEIIANEKNIMYEWSQRANSLHVNDLLGKLGYSKKGQAILDWWREPLKELAEAKRFVAEGGPEKAEREKKLAQEKLEADIILKRKKFEESLEKKEKTDEKD
jgi:hypothetical protein